LIELLVVIVIIAILAGFLLPVLVRVKAKTRSLVCLNHVRQWGIALWMYAEDEEEGYFPYEGNFLAPINAGPNLEAWYNTVTEYAGQSRLMELYAQGRMPLPGQRSLFGCPSVITPPAKAPTATRPFFMYGFNNRMDPNGPRRFKRQQVLEPVQTVAFTENSESHYPSTSGRFTPARHEGRANLAFVDGHAEGVRSNHYFRTAKEDSRSQEEWNQPRRVYWYPYPGAPE
jgi:prepilin-type processing-associated H-X9-DG protein